MQKIGTILWKWIEAIAYKILNICFKVCRRSLTVETFSVFMQFVKFGIVGISNTLISYVLYAGSLLILKKFAIMPVGDYLIAQIIAFALSVLWSFYWNNKMVFVQEEGKKRSVMKALLKTYVSYSFTGLFLNSILLALWVQIFHMSEFLAPIINLLISVPVNFLINKFWAFK